MSLPSPRTWLRPASAAVMAVFAIAVAGCGSSASSSSNSSAAAGATSSATTSGAAASTGGAGQQIGFEGVAIEQGSNVAPASTTQTGTVDGISCGPTEQLAYHIHAHLAVYLRGQPRALPGGIGIPASMVEPSAEGPVAAGGQCIYWLHTHAPDGVIHVESPTRRIYTLGNFFDEWHQPLDAHAVGTLSGPVSAIVGGRPWARNIRDIPLEPHAVIQLNVGQPAARFHGLSWAGLQL